MLTQLKLITLILEIKHDCKKLYILLPPSQLEEIWLSLMYHAVIAIVIFRAKVKYLTLKHLRS